jgi:hypothetical protein
MLKDMRAGWDADNEKLLCLIVLQDKFSRLLSTTAGAAYFRGFITASRRTGLVSLKFRFAYLDGERSWFTLPERDAEGALEFFRGVVRGMFEATGKHTDRQLPDGALQFFEPPDDEGDGMRTIEWLVAKDLVEIKGIRPSGEERGTSPC